MNARVSSRVGVTLIGWAEVGKLFCRARFGCDPGRQFAPCPPAFIGVRWIAKSLRQFRSCHSQFSPTSTTRGRRLNHQTSPPFSNCIPRLVIGNQYFMHLLTLADADVFDLAPGAIVSARSSSRMLGILGTKISPPCICSMQLVHKPTHAPASAERVMRGSVMVILPRFAARQNRDHAAPACRPRSRNARTEARILRAGRRRLACTNIFSAHSL